MKKAEMLLRLGRGRIAAELLAGLAIAFGLLARIQGLGGLELAGVGLLVGASLLLVVQAPIGTVPLGYAFIIALTELAPPEKFLVIVGVGLLSAVAPLLARYTASDVGRRVLRWALASSAGIGASMAVRAIVPGTSGSATLLHVGVAGFVFLVTDLLARRYLPTTTAPPLGFSTAWPVHLSLLCAAGLIAVAYRVDGPWMAGVALFPLVLTRFAYDRLAAAEMAYRQTIKALSIVPEVAGVTGLGHGERCAVYADALAGAIGLAADATERVVTAARLHHIGYVTLDDPDEASPLDECDLAHLGGEILHETGFLAEVGDLVSNMHDPDHDSREAAVVRIASSFDHIVGEERLRATRAIDALRFHYGDAQSDEVIAALEELLVNEPDLLERAHLSASPLTDAAAASGGVLVRG